MKKLREGLVKGVLSACPHECDYEICVYMHTAHLYNHHLHLSLKVAITPIPSSICAFIGSVVNLFSVWYLAWGQTEIGLFNRPLSL